MRGVNLGGWLVLEKWITPSVFKGTMAQDEYGLCRELGDKRHERLEQHRKSWITSEDISWIKENGLDAIRLPVPHWSFGGYEAFIECVPQIDFAFEQARLNGLKVLLDLHTAPGSQNGHDHSGKAGQTGWTEQENIDATLSALGQLAERYGGHETLLGIEVLNEPSSKISKKLLRTYYEEAVQAVHRHAEVPVIISDSFQPDVWSKELTEMWLDMHMYQVFSADDKKRPIHKVIKKAKYEWAEQLRAIHQKRPVVIGEWSLALGRKVLRGMDDYERDKAMQAYWYAQTAAFEETNGWFYWTYKTEDGGAWSFRDSVQRGWIQMPIERPFTPRQQ